MSSSPNDSLRMVEAIWDPQLRILGEFALNHHCWYYQSQQLTTALCSSWVSSHTFSPLSSFRCDSLEYSWCCDFGRSERCSILAIVMESAHQQKLRKSHNVCWPSSPLSSPTPSSQTSIADISDQCHHRRWRTFFKQARNFGLFRLFYCEFTHFLAYFLLFTCPRMLWRNTKTDKYRACQHQVSTTRLNINANIKAHQQVSKCPLRLDV